MVVVKRWVVVAIALLMGMGAAPAWASVYRDTEGRLYIDELPPRATVHVAYQNRTRRVTMRPSGDCNLFQMWHTNRFWLWSYGKVTLYTSPSITFNPNTLPQAEYGAEVCQNGTINQTLPWQAIAPGVKAIRAYRVGWNRYSGDDALMVFVQGLPYQPFEATDYAPAQRFGRANTCGIVRFSNTALWDNEDLGNGFYFYVNRYPTGELYNYSNLPVREVVPFCRNGVLYDAG